MNDLEIREIEIASPIDSLKVGDDFSYKGQYKDGYGEGISKIKRFYKEVPFWGGVEEKVNKNYHGVYPVCMELENCKIILLGFLHYKDKLELSDRFKW